MTSNVEVDDLGYALPSLSDHEGPDQILKAQLDRTWEYNERVRIKVDKESDFQPLSIPGLLTSIAEKHPYHTALVSRPDPYNERMILTYKEYAKQVRYVAKAFLDLGLERHHGVCILGSNSPHWFICDIAAIYAGGFAAGVYTTNSPEACKHCALISRANIFVVEDEIQLEKVMEIRKKLPELKAIIQYEGVSKYPQVYSWEQLLMKGKDLPEDRLNEVLKTIGINECCTVVYTSGTIGNPKAVMLSHDNLISNARGIVKRMNLRTEAKEVMVSFLPLSHVAAQVVDIFLPMMIGATVYMGDQKALKGTLVNTLKYARPTFFLGVPRVWEKFYEKMQSVVKEYGNMRTWIYSWAKNQGFSYHMKRMNGEQHSRWSYVIAKWLVFNNVKASLGLNRCKIFGTAAAPLSTEMKKYFMSLDMVIIDAFGMSECAGGHTVTTIDQFRFDSVGHTFPGFATKLIDVDNEGEGEICMQGRHVFMGYLDDPDNTIATKDNENWLHSGDIGKIDENGFLYVTGRMKELIITAGGENIPPNLIEQLVKDQCPAISHAMLVGDARKYLTMLITLKTEIDPETGKPLTDLAADTLNWLTSLGSESKTVTEIIEKPDLIVDKAIKEAVDRANLKATSNAQRIQKFRILPRDFSMPTGELGPTLKLKRKVVLNKYAELINKMYEE